MAWDSNEPKREELTEEERRAIAEIWQAAVSKREPPNDPMLVYGVGFLVGMLKRYVHLRDPEATPRSLRRGDPEKPAQ